MALSVIGGLLSWVRFQTLNLKTGCLLAATPLFSTNCRESGLVHPPTAAVVEPMADRPPSVEKGPPSSVTFVTRDLHTAFGRQGFFGCVHAPGQDGLEAGHRFQRYNNKDRRKEPETMSAMHGDPPTMVYAPKDW